MIVLVVMMVELSEWAMVVAAMKVVMEATVITGIRMLLGMMERKEEFVVEELLKETMMRYRGVGGSAGIENTVMMVTELMAGVSMVVG